MTFLLILCRLYYPWGNTGAGQNLSGFSQTVFNATSCRDNGSAVDPPAQFFSGGRCLTVWLANLPPVAPLKMENGELTLYFLLSCLFFLGIFRSKG